MPNARQKCRSSTTSIRALVQLALALSIHVRINFPIQRLYVPVDVAHPEKGCVTDDTKTDGWSATSVVCWNYFRGQARNPEDRRTSWACMRAIISLADGLSGVMEIGLLLTAVALF
jgi:hypothetical protein